MIALNRSSACPESIARRHRDAPRRDRRATPAATSMRSLSSSAVRDEVGAPPPFNNSMHSMTSLALPTARPIGAVHGRDHRLRLHAGGFADGDERLGERAGLCLASS